MVFVFKKKFTNLIYVFEGWIIDNIHKVHIYNIWAIWHRWYVVFCSHICNFCCKIKKKSPLTQM